MKRQTNIATQGKQPIHGSVYLGSDGQLWEMTPRGQVTVASSGDAAVEYAKANAWPLRKVQYLRIMGNRWQ